MVFSKKMVIILILLISFLMLFIPRTISGVDNPQDINKTYNNNTQRIELKNKNNNQNIAKITLNTPLNNYVMRGKDRLVAEFTIENFNNYNNVFNDLKFYDTRNNMSEFSRSFSYRYKNYYDMLVDDYEEICKERPANLTDIEYYDCYKSKIGSHIEKRFTWEDFNKKAKLNKGNITLGIFTDVFPNEKIEWIPTLFNIRIEEWAIWTEALNTDLLVYWKLNETSGTNIEDSIDNYDLTTNSSNWTAGRIDNGLEFNSTGYRAWNDTFLDANQTDLSFSFWFKVPIDFNNTAPVDMSLFDKSDQFNVNHIRAILESGAGALRINIIGENQGGGTNLDSNYTNLVAGTWYHVAIVWDGGSNVSLYVNGQHNETADYTGKLNTTTLDYDFAIGGSFRSGNEFNGTIDEFGVWNRTLTASEISDLYNGGSGITYTNVFDSTSPNITINQPTNIIYNTNSINFNATTLDETSMTEGSCWVSIDAGVTNLTLLNTTNNDDYNATNITVPDGGYQAQFWCNDTANNVNNSETIDFTVDTTKWTTWQESLNAGLMAYWSLDETSGTNIEDSIDNYDLTTNSSNWTAGRIDNGLEFNSTGYRAWNDTFLDANQTDLSFSFWFKVPIDFNNTAPVDMSLFDKSDQFNVNHIRAILESGAGVLRVSLEGEDIESPSLGSNYTNLVAGTWYHTVIIWDGGSNVSLYVNGQLNQTADYTGKLNTTTLDYDFAIGGSFRSGNEFNGTIDEFGVWNRPLTISEITGLYNDGEGIAIDTTPPNLTINTPTNTTFTTNSIDFNVTALDSIRINSCWVSIDAGVTNLTLLNTTNNDDYNATNTTVPDGGYQAQFWCNDSINNINNTETQDFLVNTIPPDIEIKFPTNNTNTTDTVLNVNYTRSDTNLDSCWFSNDSYSTNTTLASCVNITTVTWIEGQHNVTVWANDSANNVNRSDVRFTIDTINPNINITFPTNNTNTTDTALDVNYTTFDTNLDSCWYTNDTLAVNTTLASCINLTTITWAEGQHNVTVYANDSAGNENSSSVTFRIDTTPPDLVLVEPQAINYANNNTVELNYSVSDSTLEVDTCWFRVDLISPPLPAIANTTIANCVNTTFALPGGDEDYNLTLWSNDTLNNVNKTTVIFGIRTNTPAVSLQSPTNNQFLNNGTNIYFNFTATDEDGLSTCQLYGNWTGTFSKNFTWLSPTNATQNFTQVNITQGDAEYKWNVFCNDTLNNGDWASSNFTFTIDETFPNITINSFSTIAGSQTFSFNSTEQDLNIDSCKYSIFNSSGGIDGTGGSNENISYTCGSGLSHSATTTLFTTYNLTIYSIDLVGNENSTTQEFTISTSPSAPSSGGGGGGAAPEEPKIPVIILLEANLSKSYSELDRAIIFAEINRFCAEKVTGEALAITDFSGECQLTLNEIDLISVNIGAKGLQVPQDDLIIFFRLFQDKELEQGFATEEEIKELGLFSSILGNIQPFSIFPPSVSTPIFKFTFDEKIIINKTFTSNRPIRSCEVIETDGDVDFSVNCSIISNNSVQTSFIINDTDFFNENFDAEFSIVSLDVPEFTEVKPLNINYNLFNFQFEFLGFPVFIFIIGVFSFIIIIIVVIILNRRFRKKS